jgi:hypothetical protein
MLLCITCGLLSVPYESRYADLEELVLVWTLYMR